MGKPFVKLVLDSTIHQIQKIKLTNENDLVFMKYNTLIQNIGKVKTIYVCNKKDYSFVTVPLICEYFKIKIYEIDSDKFKNGFLVEMNDC